MSDQRWDKTEERGDHVLRERERVCVALFVDYGVNERGERVREEAGRVFLHRQYLPSAMRLALPQPAHHSHLRLLQTLSGTSARLLQSPTSGVV